MESNARYKREFIYDYDMEDPSQTYQKEMRFGFIRKVYGILSLQLAITVLMTIFSMTVASFAKFQKESTFMYIICLVLIIVLPIVIACCKSVMMKVPQNYIILFVFTFAESYFVSFICSISNPSIVFMAAFMTLAITIALTIYAYTTKTDFTIQGGMFFVLGCAFLLLVIFGMFTRNNVFHIIICVFGVILFGLYILYDTQLIVGNKELSLGIDDYILGAFMLYIDIINLFLYILELLQRLNNN